MAKIEVVKQHDLKDCGACSLSCIIKYYDGYVPIEKIRDDTFTTGVGTTAYNLVEASRSYGFEATGVFVDDVKNENIYLPAIAHIVLKNGLNHFVVVYKISKNYVWLMDPAVGKTKMKIDDFNNIWDNILILLTPIDKILKYDKDLTISSLLMKLIMKNKSVFIKICIINLIVMFFTILTSFYFQITISSINHGEDIIYLKAIIIIFTLTFFFKVFLNFNKNYYLTYFYRNLDVELFSNFLEHIFNLPLKFIQNRSTGEIVSRIQDLSEIKDLLSEFFTNVLLNTILIIGAIVVLYSINSKLFFILCLVVIIYVILGLLFSKLIYGCVRDNVNTSTTFNSCLVENIEANTSIKNLNLVDHFLKYLEEKLIIMFKSNFKTQSTLNNVSFIKEFIYEMGTFLVLSIGVLLIADGNLDLLSLITFQSLMFYFTNPIQDFIDLIPKFNYLKASFNKLSEFINIECDDYEKGINSLNNYSIEFINVSFKYNFTNILTNVSFKIDDGDKVFLKGPSGSGKSTICNMLAYPKDIIDGTIKIGGINRADYSLGTTLKTILYVGQNEKLITGTIRDNILSFRSVSDEDFEKVVRICKLESIVEKRPNRYDSIINAMQNNLSGGELQRIILARALLKQAKILILDEALSEVNFDLELDIIEDIKKYYPTNTLIYVSHKDVSCKFTKILDMEIINGKFISE
jgi:ATP-binding cassette subfamily B protein